MHFADANRRAGLLTLTSYDLFLLTLKQSKCQAPLTQQNNHLPKVTGGEAQSIFYAIFLKYFSEADYFA